MSDTSHEFLQQYQKEKEQVNTLSLCSFSLFTNGVLSGGAEWAEWEPPLYFGWRFSRTKVRTVWIRTTWRWWKALYIITYWKLPPLSTSSPLHLFTPPPSPPTSASHHHHLTRAPHKLALIVATPSSGGPTRGKLPLTKFSAPQWWWPPQTSLRAWEHQIPALFYQKMTPPHCT